MVIDRVTASPGHPCPKASACVCAALHDKGFTGMVLDDPGGPSAIKGAPHEGGRWVGLRDSHVRTNRGGVMCVKMEEGSRARECGRFQKLERTENRSPWSLQRASPADTFVLTP